MSNFCRILIHQERVRALPFLGVFREAKISWCLSLLFGHCFNRRARKSSRGRKRGEHCWPRGPRRLFDRLFSLSDYDEIDAKCILRLTRIHRDTSSDTTYRTTRHADRLQRTQFTHNSNACISWDACARVYVYRGMWFKMRLRESKNGIRPCKI